MRPIKLVISAFGPYAEKTTIDMELLGKSGIYHISGDTGAGKTSIFDAICYALFGSASGESRNYTEQFRCAHAKPEVKTEVDLTFFYGNKIYRILRNPEYNRPKKRGEGFTTESASVTLFTPDENGGQSDSSRAISGIENVSNEIKKILGVNKSQFSQIAMIAQGEFKKLLLADSLTRQEIFRKIFRTDNYQTLQNKLKEKAKSSEDTYSQQKNSANDLVKQIQCNEQSDYFFEINQYKNLATDSQKEICHWDLVCKCIQKVVEEDASIYNQIENEKSLLSKELDDINKKLGQAEELNNISTKLEQVEREIEEYSKKLISLKNIKEQAESKQNLNEKLQTEIILIKNSLSDYDKLESKNEEFSKNNKELANLLKELEDNKKNIKQINEDLDKYENEIQSLENVGVNIKKIEIQIETIQNRQKEINDIGNKVKEFNTLEKEYEDAKQAYLNSDKLYEQKREDYESKNRAFLNEQAGILAESLKENKPCPVCGSLTHPHKAEKSQKAPSQKDLEQLKNELKILEDSRNKKNSKVANLKGQYDNTKNSINEVIQKAFPNYSLENIREKGNEEFNQNKEDLISLEQSKQQEIAKESRKNFLEREIPQKRKNLEILKENFKKCEIQISTIKTKQDTIEKNLEEISKNLKYKNKKEASNTLQEKITEKEKLQQEISDAQKNFNDCDKQIHSLKTTQETLSKQIENAPKQKLDELQSKQEFLKNKQLNLDIKGKKVFSQKENNERIVNEITEKVKIIDDLNAERIVAKTLSDTVNGKLAGKERAKLEIYVQSFYFNQIVSKANLRFKELSNGQYELVRRKNATDKMHVQGLDLNVIDHYNGTEREVRTLSGGESFLASLSLALGFADVVQSSAGGIRLDSLFIDEGFDSLDEDSLKRAVDILINLAGDNRLIGIISHIKELEKRIEKIIFVKKDINNISRVSIQV